MFISHPYLIQFLRNSSRPRRPHRRNISLCCSVQCNMATKVTDILQKSTLLCSSVRKRSIGSRRVDQNVMELGSCAAMAEYKLPNLDENSNNVALLSSSGFAWTLEKITEQELDRLVRGTYDFITDKTSEKKESKGRQAAEGRYEEWQKLYEQKELRVWRKPVNSRGLYEYKVYGTFSDINAEAFYQTQVDTEYRKHWDSFTKELDIIDTDHSSENEVHHWVMNYPYPLKSRDYVYVRRSKIDHKSGTMVIVSKATDHPSRPDDQGHVRVTDYRSEMVIMPHKNFTEDGLDFVLTFLNDPKATIPSYCMNVITEFTGIPGMIKTFYDAAKNQKNYSAKQGGQ